ncbi:hypothetical protein DSUL_150019 [Desulfovibrionales bacterium]
MITTDLVVMGKECGKSIVKKSPSGIRAINVDQRSVKKIVN